MPGFNADLYQKYHKIWPTGFAKVAVQSVQAVLLPLSNNSSFKPNKPQSLGTAVFSVSRVTVQTGVTVFRFRHQNTHLREKSIVSPTEKSKKLLFFWGHNLPARLKIWLAFSSSCDILESLALDVSKQYAARPG